MAEHRLPVAVGRHAFQNPRFQLFNELPEDRYEAFLSVPVLSRGKLVGVQRQGRQRRKTKKEIAEAIVIADELRRGKAGS